MRTIPPLHASHWLACLLMAVIGALPLWPLGGRLSPHDLYRAVECGILLVAALSLASRPGPMPTGNARVAVWLMAALLVLASCWHSRHPLAALQESALWLGLLGWGLLCRRCVAEGGMRPLLRAMVLVMAAYAALVLLVYGLSLASRQALDSRAFILGFDNPRFLNHVQAVAVPLLWAAARSDEDRRWRWTATAASVMHVALAAMTLARATLLAWAVALLVLMVWREWRVIRFGWACLVSGLLLSALTFLALPMALGLSWTPSFASPAELGSAHSRDLLWVVALQQFLDSPWLGQGPMHFAATVNPKGAHPHNVYLQLAAEIGLPGTLLLLGLLAVPVVRGLRRLRQVKVATTPLACLLAAALAALVDAALSGNFVMPLSQLWIVAAWGMLAGLLANSAPAPAPTRERGSALLAGMLIATQLGLCVLISTQLQREPPRVRVDGPVPVPGETYRPRFWLNGWI